jgi:hypothetical protein
MVAGTYLWGLWATDSRFISMEREVWQVVEESERVVIVSASTGH